MAAVRALAFGQDIGSSSIILEGDSEVVMKALESYDDSLASFGLLTEDTKLIAESFHLAYFSHTHKQGNSVAYNFFRQARYVSGYLDMLAVIWCGWRIFFHTFLRYS